MNPATQTEREGTSFAEAALRLSGKSEEEARRTGAMDRADEQVEALFAAKYQTAQSPVHQAVWDGKVPLNLFAPTPQPAAACDLAMDKSLAVVRRRRLVGPLQPHPIRRDPRHARPRLGRREATVRRSSPPRPAVASRARPANVSATVMHMGCAWVVHALCM